MNLQHELNALRVFLSTAPTLFDRDKNIEIKSYRLPNGENISCILYNSIFYITSTDIVKITNFRHQLIGRPIHSSYVRKFEEGIFSDLRRLKQYIDWSFEESNSELLDFLVSKKAAKKAKKQKIYHWWSIPHDELFASSVFRTVKRGAPSDYDDKEIADMMRNSEELRLIRAQGSIYLHEYATIMGS